MIASISVRNFLGLRAADLELPPGVTLVAADNFAGKTSLQQAIRLCLTGEVARVRLKKDYRKLVREGADRASITWGDGGEERSVRIDGGKLVGDIPIQHPALPYVLDPSRIARLDPAGLSALLLEAADTRADGEEVASRLREEGALQEMIDDLAPLLAAGFAPAQRRANEMRREAAREWETLAGEKYGATKAETWKPDVSAAHSEIDRAVSESHSLRKQLPALARELDSAAAAVAEHQRDYDLLTTGSTAHHEDCPACGEALIVLNDKSLIRKDEHLEAIKARKDLKEVGVALQFCKERFRGYSDRIDVIQKTIERAENAQAEAEKVDADAKALAAKAKTIHARAVLWGRVEEALSPERIPSDLCANVLQRVNARLLAEEKRFGQVSVSRDMEITLKGREYGLLSESEQWLCDALLADAVADIAGITIRMLDRVDVLAPARRGQVVGWAKSLGVQVILFATAKQPPSIPGVQCVWIDGGAVSSGSVTA